MTVCFRRRLPTCFPCAQALAIIGCFAHMNLRWRSLLKGIAHRLRRILFGWIVLVLRTPFRRLLKPVSRFALRNRASPEHRTRRRVANHSRHVGHLAFLAARTFAASDRFRAR